MANHRYDAIVVGARCAGSPTAMLLARKGYKVLVVDRATFPSDTVSTHLLHPPGVAALRRWGLLERLVASGCPADPHLRLRLRPLHPLRRPRDRRGPGRLRPPTHRAGQAARRRRRPGRRGGPRGLHRRGGRGRRQRGRVTGVRGHGRQGRTVTEHARVVVGADGRHSTRRPGGRPEQYHEQPPLQVSYYSYWSGLPMDGRFQTWIRPDRAFAAWPTHHDLTLVIGGWPSAEVQANRNDVEANSLKMLELAPAFADRVGDAGYTKDFITAQGMHDAFRDAELCATALDEAFTGTRSFDTAMGRYQATRDTQVLPMYELTTQLATLQPPPPDLQRLLGAIHGNQEAMDEFAQVIAGVLSPAEFFSEDNVRRITLRAGAAAPA